MRILKSEAFTVVFTLVRILKSEVFTTVLFVKILSEKILELLCYVTEDLKV